MPAQDFHTDRLTKENNKLLKENNKLLKKMHRAHVMGIWFKIIFYVLILAVPYFIYKNYLEDSFLELMSAYEDLKSEVAEVKQLSEKLPF